MSIGDDDPDRSKENEVRQRDLSSNHQAEAMALKAMDALLELMKCGADPEKMRLAMTTLENERGLLEEYAGKSENLCKNLVYSWSESIKAAIDNLIDREKSRLSMHDVKMENLEETKQDELELCDVSDDEVIGNEEETEERLITAKQEPKKPDEVADIVENPGALADVLEQDSASGISVILEEAKIDDGKPKTKRHRALKYKCASCGKLFRTAQHVRTHELMHLDSEEARRPFECDVCGKRFTQISNLGTHKRTHLPDDDPRRKRDARVQCDICGKMICGKYDLKKHKQLHLDDETARKPFACETCGHRFLMSHDLKMHKKTHLEDDDPYKGGQKCDVCGKLFLKTRNFEIHIKTHLDDFDPEQARIKRPFVCETCGRAFTMEQNLKVHKALHTGDAKARKTHQCSVCNKFYTKDSLPKHVKSHAHKVIFDCELCDSTFSRKATLEKHLQMYHPARAPSHKSTNDSGKFECEYCGKTLSQKTHLDKHKQRYHPVRNSSIKSASSHVIPERSECSDDSSDE